MMELRRMGGFVEHRKTDKSAPPVLARWAKREAERHKATSISYYYEPREGETMGVMGWTGEVEWPPHR